MTGSNKIAFAGLVISLLVYGVQDIRRQTAYETRLDMLSAWQVEHQKTESLTIATNQKVDALTATVEKMATNMERFLEEIYKLKAHTGVDDERSNRERPTGRIQSSR